MDLVLRYHMGSNINRKYIRRVAAKCKIQNALSCSIVTVETNKLKVEVKDKNNKRSAYRLRTDFLYELLQRLRNQRKQSD